MLNVEAVSVCFFSFLCFDPLSINNYCSRKPTQPSKPSQRQVNGIVACSIRQTWNALEQASKKEWNAV
jgi:hypothetical protein